MSTVTVPAVLLRSHPYSESSLILRFLTPDHGVVAVLARGLRRRSSRGEAPLQTFQRGLLTFQHRADRDLHGFRDFQASSTPRALAGDLARFSGASFLAEIVLLHALQEADPELHHRLVWLLERLESAPLGELPGWILSGAWSLMVAFGFPPILEDCLVCGKPVPQEGMGRFDLEGGGIRCPACAGPGGGPRLGPGARKALRELATGNTPPRLRGGVAHLTLVERYALHHLGGRRPFHSTPLLRSSLERLEPAAERQRAEGEEPGGEPSGAPGDPTGGA